LIVKHVRFSSKVLCVIKEIPCFRPCWEFANQLCAAKPMMLAANWWPVRVWHSYLDLIATSTSYCLILRVLEHLQWHPNDVQLKRRISRLGDATPWCRIQRVCF
jgi:hypothetical protein